MTKSMSVMCSHQLRQAARLLAKAMVEAGYLPDAELIYHISFYEIGQLLRTRAPSILQKYTV